MAGNNLIGLCATPFEPLRGASIQQPCPFPRQPLQTFLPHPLCRIVVCASIPARPECEEMRCTQGIFWTTTLVHYASCSLPTVQTDTFHAPKCRRCRRKNFLRCVESHDTCTLLLRTRFAKPPNAHGTTCILLPPKKMRGQPHAPPNNRRRLLTLERLADTQIPMQTPPDCRVNFAGTRQTLDA